MKLIHHGPWQKLELDQKRSEMESFTGLMRRDLQGIYERRETVKHISLWVVHGGDKSLKSTTN